MFTGIVEEVGSIQAIKRGSVSSSLVIQGSLIFDDLKLGDSVAVNGVCLTVAALSNKTFDADVMHETLSRSGLGALTQGSPVNLERAMPLNGRFGGHIVSGHIDGTGTIVSIKNDENAVWYEIAASAPIMRYVVEKGSIAIDGVSLTIAGVTAESFKVSIIPHTLSNTVMGGLRVGSTVNLENDVVGKYVEKLLGLSQHDSGHNEASGITAEFLAEYGF